MPEGDTIWRTAAGLRAGVGGRMVTAARPDRLGALAGRTLESVEPVGKHLLMRFSGGLTLHSHMRMNGSWHLYRTGERWRRPERQARAVLEFGDRVAVCFAAPTLELVRDGREAVRHLGPDLLAEGVRLDEVVARARAIGPVAVGELLLDQRVCCGIGNVYRCETLWQRRCDPWRSSAALADAELAELFAFARDALRENLGGSERRFGGRPAAVHGRRGRPCPRCGAPVRARGQGEHARLTYWCPSCQV
ncbi:MAG TPA: DNA-formamidopyrimidine glycosylase family protein [Candidatus Dormibacteraeota bacterium]|nr:DNA-formamidopyrimidine glycosylase family protein [Candidatus Dormibacteraeota bacterium]